MRLIGIFAALTAAVGIVSVAGCSSSSNNNSGGGSGSPDASLPTSDAGHLDASPSSDAGSEDAGDDSDLPPTPAAWNAPITQPSDSTALAGRAACTFKRGDMPATTLGSSTPLDTQIPIENIVIVMMENRSFDSMLGHMNEAFTRTDVAEPPAGASNPSQPGADAGVAHPFMHAPHQCFADTDHSWHGQHVSWDNGANDGFYLTNNGNDDNGNPVALDADGGVPVLYDGERSLWWYDNTDIPFEYSLANSYAFADHYFCSTLGPTYPNRDYLLASTSFGETENTDFPNVSANLADNVVLTDELEQRHATWALYTDGTPGLATVLNIGFVNRYDRGVRFGFSDFLSDAKAGKLPQVSIVDPNLGTADGTPTNNDQHPPSDVQIGSAFLQQLVTAVTTSPQWAHTALFITWDENGGEYDHLPPPKACAPDTIAPILIPGTTDVGVVGDFAQYGFRVPLIVVSPYAKKGYVGHTVYDHTSITRFVEAKFKIPALTGRDANADPLMDLFDFSTPALLTPPTLTPPVEDDAGLQYCVSTY